MEEWRQFITKFSLRSYQKGQLIVCQDTVPPYCYVVRKGFVKTYLITAEGDEKPISFEGKNDIFPFDVVFGHSQEAKYYYEAYTDCELYHIPCNEFIAFVKVHPHLFTRLFHYLIDRTLGYHEHIASLEHAKAVDKLLFALNLLTKRFGRQVARSRSLMMLPITQQDLANFLGLTRETTGTQLKTLEREGVLRYHRQKYTIYTDRLHSLLEERG
ncbi:MAG: Crp/Fnr family transcriptional regulator [Candidatus Saccharimonadales bacterium]